MRIEHSLPLPNTFHDADEYIDSLINFTSQPFFRTIVGGVHILDFFTHDPDLYTSILPRDWVEYFDQVSIEDVLDILLQKDVNILADESPHIPESLRNFIRDVRQHELQRSFDSQKLPKSR